MNSYLKIAIVIVAFVVGFFLGRKTIDVEEKVTFVKGETIRDTIVISQPTFVDLNNPNIITLDVDSEEFKQIINEEFTEQTVEEVIEL